MACYSEPVVERFSFSYWVSWYPCLKENQMCRWARFLFCVWSDPNVYRISYFHCCSLSRQEEGDQKETLCSKKRWRMMKEDTVSVSSLQTSLSKCFTPAAQTHWHTEKHTHIHTYTYSHIIKSNFFKKNIPARKQDHRGFKRAQTIFPSETYSGIGHPLLYSI